MTHYTETEYQGLLSKSVIRRYDIQDPEATLSKDIRGWAKKQGYPALVLRQSIKARGFITPGWPDVTLILPNRILFLELKAPKGGTLRENQRLIAQMIRTLGHEWHKVKTWKEFMEIIGE